MRVVVDTGKKQDLTAAALRLLDSRLRAKWPSLVSWSYSPLTGELALEFDEERRLATLAQGTGAEGVLLRAEVFRGEVTREDLYATSA